MHTCGTEQRLLISGAANGAVCDATAEQSRTRSFVLAQKCSVGAYGHEQEHKVREYKIQKNSVKSSLVTFHFYFYTSSGALEKNYNFNARLKSQ